VHVCRWRLDAAFQRYRRRCFGNRRYLDSLLAKRFYAQACKSAVGSMGAMLFAAVSVHAEPAASPRMVCGLEVSAGSSVSADRVTLKSTLSGVDSLGIGVLGALGADGFDLRT
jgi:hypothetical protein